MREVISGIVKDRFLHISNTGTFYVDGGFTEKAAEFLVEVRLDALKLTFVSAEEHDKTVECLIDHVRIDGRLGESVELGAQQIRNLKMSGIVFASSKAS